MPPQGRLVFVDRIFREAFWIARTSDADQGRVRVRTRVPKTGRLRSLTDDVRHAVPVCVGDLPTLPKARVMASHTPERLTNAQIRRVLRWYAKQQRFLRENGTVATVANSHGVATGVIYRCIDNFKKPPVARKRLRSFGRPGILSALQVRAVRVWYVKKLGFLKSHGTVADLAQELRATPSAIYACIRRGGVYRSPFGEVVPRRRTTPRGTESTVDGDSQMRSKLLRTWCESGFNRSHEPARPSMGAKRGRRGHRQTP